MSALVIISIPYSSFKEKIRITKQYSGKRISIYENFIIVEMRRI